MITVCGAGASGVTTAIVLARRGFKVRLIEKSTQIARKIRASGNGRCNIANRNPEPQRFFSQRPDILKEILKGGNIDMVLEFLRSLGVAVVEKDEGKIFPMSFSGACVIDLLEFELKRLGVEIVLGVEITSIKKDRKSFILNSKEGTFFAKSLILAMGSPAMPKLGGSDIGLNIAQDFGHEILEPDPALVQLNSPLKWLKYVAGVKREVNIKLMADYGELITSKRGDVLFTKYGLSGLAILDISREAVLALKSYKKVEVVIDLLPDLSKWEFLNHLRRRLDEGRGLPTELWLEGLLEKKLAKMIMREFKFIQNEKRIDRVDYGYIFKILKKDLRIPIESSRGFEYAEVASGGVDLSDINPKTLESKKVKNLYILGEMLDVVGDRGGFNLYFAWLTGLIAGEAINGR